MKRLYYKLMHKYKMRYNKEYQEEFAYYLKLLGAITHTDLKEK